MSDDEQEDLASDEVEGLDKAELPDDGEGPEAGTALVRSKPTSLRGSDSLAFYLAEVRRYPLLDPEEEKALAIRYAETGDREAAQRLLTANLRLVVRLAFQYHRQWANVLDLIQEGNVGLVEALSRYDPYRGIRFSSYAQYWIRAMILRYLMDHYRVVRLGSTRHGRKLFFQLQKEKDRLEKAGFVASTKRLADALDVPEREVIQVDQHLRAPALSLSAPAPGTEEGRSLEESVPDLDGSNPEEAVASGELGATIKAVLEEFRHTLTDEREIAIWNERLTAQEPASLTDLGDRYQVTKERIRQVESRIKSRLKEFLKDALGDEIDFEFEVPEER